MKNIKISLILLVFGLLPACEKPDPNPHLKDASFVLYSEEARAIDAEVKSAEAAVASAELDLKAVTPQTGQIKFAQKRYWEAVSKLEKAKQVQNLAKMRVQVREAQIRSKYLDSYYQKVELQEPNKEDLLAQRNLASTPREWSVAKRRAALGLPTKSNKPGEAAPEKPKAEAGGH